MVKFKKPNQLNGEQLITELNLAGIQTKDFPSIDGEGNLWLDIDEKDKSKAETIVSSHLGIDFSIAKKTARQAILDRIGLTAEEAQLLLGGN